IDELVRRHAGRVWIIAAEDLKTAETLAEDTAVFHSAAADARPRETLILPEATPDSRDMREAFAASADRTRVLSRLRAAPEGASPPPLLIFTTPAALLQPVPAIEAFASRELVLTRGQAQAFQALL